MVMEAQCCVVFFALMSDPVGSTELCEMRINGIAGLGKWILAGRVAQAVMRMSPEQVHDNEFALVGLGNGALYAIEQFTIQRLTGSSGNAIDDFYDIGKLRVLLFDCHVVVIADPPGSVAGCLGHGDDVGAAIFVFSYAAEVQEAVE